VTTLVLCRHADPAEPGQARLLAQTLGPLELAAVYTSPLGRAVHTATAVARQHGLEPVEIEDLREIDFGEVDGRDFDEFPTELQQALLHAPTRARFPGGESYEDLQQRVCSALDRIVGQHPGVTVAVVSHAGSIRAALGAWLQIRDDAVFRIAQRFGAVNVVECLDGVPLVRLVNGTQP